MTNGCSGPNHQKACSHGQQQQTDRGPRTRNKFVSKLTPQVISLSFHLLHLELDGGFDLFNLGGHRLAVGEGGREFTSLVETRTKKTGDLLDESFTGQKGVIFLGCRNTGINNWFF